ncbi:MAG TPA: alpha/beta fold hydrolase [Puia sp.]|nr:alpha/beta fold hydrolase [Puia sp.]
MQKIVVQIFLLLIVGQVFPQTKSIGYWTGSMDREGSILKIADEFNIKDGKTIGFFNAVSQRASGIPLDSIAVMNDSLQFQLMSEPVTYFKCKVSGDKITGEFIQEGFSKGMISLSRSIKPSPSFEYSDTSFISGKNKISCRIYFPKENGKFPSVVFLHGSGGEGMFANQYLGEYLASKGVVTLIQDKQGVGKSTGNWTTANFDDLTDDYANAVHFLKLFGKVSKQEIGIYGHSQGATIAPLLASKCKDVSFIIAAAAIGDSVYKQDLYRVENNLKSNDFTNIEIKEAMTYYKQWLEMARTGIGFNKLDSLNNSSKDKKWFEWVEAPPKEHWIWKYYLATGNYNSLAYWKNITVPVLLVYGENDQIEDIKTYLSNIDSVLKSRQKVKDITEIILPNAQHNLCIFPSKKDKFFWWYLSYGYEDLITSWIKYRFKN